ncbi:MAG: hypothetical protein HY741_13425 [Chloroflexi bacterium]|nr:hypothetical protein [Chloroflexota bacterium]
MAKVKMNPVIEQLRGKIGDLVFKRYGDEVVVARKPDLTGQAPTEAQAAVREQFRQAALYGKMVMADPATKTIYEEAAKAKGQPVFSLTIADFFNAPSVGEVDLSAYAGRVGDTIAIRAHDDFDVTAVKVAIAQADGTAVEEGAATETPPDSGRWTYKATVAVPTGTSVRITVTATDRPGHAGAKEVSKP